MTIQTKRAKGTAHVEIDYERCDACGLCVAVCKGAPLYMQEGMVQIDQQNLFGCIACGACVAVCPQDCIQVRGRDLSPEDMFPLPAGYAQASYETLTALFLKRRSVRNFNDKAVSRESIQAILDAVTTAPMGLPPTEVEVLVLENQAAVQRFSADVIAYFKKIKWLFSDLVLVLLRPFMAKETAAMVRDFLAVAIHGILEKNIQGEDWLTYDAPCALYFYTSRYADPADPIIAATYAMLAAEALGLGSCMLGTIPYCFQYSRKLRKTYQIPNKSQQGLMLILGYPAVSYQRGIHRRLGQIRFITQ